MPFTFAHPLYAAPLKWIKPKYISLTGLILGSMSPDFEYFIALEPSQSIGHSTMGLFLHAIPLCILFAYIFHFLVKGPFTANLPSIFKLDARAQGLVKRWSLNTWSSWGLFILSVIVGFYSHIFVDAFTHQSGFFAMRYPLLQQLVLGLPLYKWFQYTLSIIGLLLELVIVIYILAKVQLKRDFIRVSSRAKASYWVTVFIIALATISLKLVFTSSTNYIGILIVASITGCFIGIVVASVMSRMKLNYSKI